MMSLSLYQEFMFMIKTRYFELYQSHVDLTQYYVVCSNYCRMNRPQLGVCSYAK